MFVQLSKSDEGKTTGHLATFMHRFGMYVLGEKYVWWPRARNRRLIFLWNISPFYLKKNKNKKSRTQISLGQILGKLNALTLFKPRAADSSQEKPLTICLSSSLLPDNTFTTFQIALAIQTPLNFHLAEPITYISLSCNGAPSKPIFDIFEGIVLPYLKM